MQTQSTLKPVAIVLLAGLAVSAPLFAQNAAGVGATTSPERDITPQEEDTLSSSAVKVLRHIAQARKALQADKPDPDKARNELAQVTKLMDAIQAALPTSNVSQRHWSDQKQAPDYQNADQVQPDLVPIYSSLDELVDFMPTAKNKAYLSNAKKALQQGHPNKAAEELHGVDDALLYVEADLPLSSTRQLVQEASKALQQNDVKTADKALGVAEDNVVFVSMTVQSPLVQARAALFRAFQDFQTGEPDFAKSELDAAVASLQRAAESADPVTRAEATKLIPQVRDLHALEKTEGKHFGARLQNIWRRVKAMSERSAEYVSTGWQRFRAHEGARKQLIDAKLQLAFARIDQFNAKDAEAAKVELAEAKGLLDAAATQIPAAQKAQLQALASQVATLQQALDSGDTAQAGERAFEQAESAVAELIGQL